MFDTVCYSCPVQIVSKNLLQGARQLKVGWNSGIPEDMGKPFLKWQKDLQPLCNLKIPRWILQSDLKNWSVHIFRDARKEVYANIIFIKSSQHTSIGFIG